MSYRKSILNSSCNSNSFILSSYDSSSLTCFSSFISFVTLSMFISTMYSFFKEMMSSSTIRTVLRSLRTEQYSTVSDVNKRIVDLMYIKSCHCSESIL